MQSLEMQCCFTLCHFLVDKIVKELEQFERSNIPKQVRIDDTDNYRAGMRIGFFGEEKDFIIIDILNEYDLTVIELGTMH